MLMEGSIKMLTSCTAMSNKVMRMSDEDIISSLPEQILHHILSYLDMKEVLLTSLLSTKWRNVWRSVPNLIFSESFWKDPVRKVLVLSKFIYFVDTVLLLRGGSNINKLSITSSKYNNLNQIQRLITYAVMRNAKEIHMVGLDIYRAKPDLLSLLARVNTLHLVSVRISSFDTQEWLHLKSQSLENLIIEDCRGFRCLGIYTPQLKYLKVENSREEYNPSGLIEIDAPKLTSLVWKGYMYKDYIFSSPSSLVTVEVDTKINSVDEHEHLNTDSSDEDEDEHEHEAIPSPDVVFGKCLRNILKELTNAKSLILSAHGFQTFSEVPDEINSLPSSFHNLKFLKLTDLDNSGNICALAKLLKSFPCLETLVLERTQAISTTTEEGGDWGQQLLFQCQFCHLKSIEIQDLEGCENELKFLEFLLKNAMVLESITIKVREALSEYKEKELGEFAKKIQSMSKASQRVKVLLLFKRIVRLAILFEEPYITYKPHPKC